MADIKTQIKRRNGTSWDTLRPETEVAQIVDIDAYVPDNLQDLDNVVFATTPASGEVLTFNGTNWVNGTGGVSKTDLQNVYVYGKASAAITKGQAIQFAGAQGGHILMKPATKEKTKF